MYLYTVGIMFDINIVLAFTFVNLNGNSLRTSL